MLNNRIPERRANSISAVVLPTPENTTLLAALGLARKTLCSSPPETTSKPAPSPATKPQNRQRRIGFDRIAQCVRNGMKRPGECIQSSPDHRCGIHIQWSSMSRRKFFE